MDTTEGNKLIAKFMEVTNEISDLYYLPQFGHYFNSYGNIEFNEVFRSTELKYHSSWDWLMPVVEKIETIDFVVIIKHGECVVVNNSGNTPKFIQQVSTTKIESTWLACVKFIKWDNDQKR